jgi:hypothetical protein
MTFSGTQDKCNACDKTVHFIDLLTADSIPYHKSCFRCSHCKGTLSMCSYSSMDGVLYCKTHFEQLFKETGTFKKNFPSGMFECLICITLYLLFFMKSQESYYYSACPVVQVQRQTVNRYRILIVFLKITYSFNFHMDQNSYFCC